MALCNECSIEVLFFVEEKNSGICNTCNSPGHQHTLDIFQRPVYSKSQGEGQYLMDLVEDA